MTNFALLSCNFFQHFSLSTSEFRDFLPATDWRISRFFQTINWGILHFFYPWSIGEFDDIFLWPTGNFYGLFLTAVWRNSQVFSRDWPTNFCGFFFSDDPLANFAIFFLYWLAKTNVAAFSYDRVEKIKGFFRERSTKFVIFSDDPLKNFEIFGRDW